jgi:DNA polymerase-3 subunit alpha (Gram-positive type)
LLHEVNRQNITITNIQKTILKIINTANKLNKKVIAVSDAYYLDPQDKQAHSVYVHTKLLGGRPHRLFRYEESNEKLPTYFLRTTSEMLEEFSFIKDQQIKEDIVINNTYEFANLIDVVLPLKTDKMYAPKIDGVNEKLFDIVTKNVKQIYGDNIPTIIRERLDKELKSIVDNGYAVVY